MPLNESLNILLVEDEEADAVLTMAALRSGPVKHNILWVDDGSRVFSVLEQDGEYANAPRPDVILLDLNMPQTDGYEVLRKIKHTHQYKAIPVFVLTHSSDNKDVENSFLNWANTYIVKPISLEKFESVLMEHRRSLKVGSLSGFDLRDGD